MKDFRLQGDHPEVLMKLIEDFPNLYTLTGRLSCKHCGVKPSWFYCFYDMVVCSNCLSRSMTVFPKKFSSDATARIKCSCGSYLKAVHGTKMSCKRCGNVATWRDPLEIQPLYHIPVDLPEKVEVLTGYKLKKVMEEGLDA